ncbi:MAG: hypothetical protein ACT4TC_22300 [Myxococcaceae bacterium]
MDFDIRAKITDEEPDEQVVEEYTEQLCALFMRSPEAKALDEQEDDFDGFFWANAMIGYGINYCGVSPAEMTAADFAEILFDIIPRKVSCDPSKAPEMVAELKAFWTFVQREYALTNAAECLGVLNDGALKKLESKLANPANFGMAKSFFMAGKEAGFDVETEAGLNAWMTTYNSSLSGQRPLGPGLPSDGSKVGTAADDANRQRLRDERKKKRQQRKASQRRNR